MEVAQDADGDADAGGGESSADEETGDGRGLRQEEVGGERAEQRRGDHAGARDEGRCEAGAGELARVGIEAGFEEQDGGADFRQQLQRRARLERQRAEEQARAELAQHRRLAEARGERAERARQRKRDGERQQRGTDLHPFSALHASCRVGDTLTGTP